jgi:hypothetical protein
MGLGWGAQRGGRDYLVLVRVVERAVRVVFDGEVEGRVPAYGCVGAVVGFGEELGAAEAGLGGAAGGEDGVVAVS